jgi:hypothetical protein
MSGKCDTEKEKSGEGARIAEPYCFTLDSFKWYKIC